MNTQSFERVCHVHCANLKALIGFQSPLQKVNIIRFVMKFIADIKRRNKAIFCHMICLR